MFKISGQTYTYSDIEAFTTNVTASIRRVQGVKTVASNSGVADAELGLQTPTTVGFCVIFVELYSDSNPHLASIDINNAIQRDIVFSDYCMKKASAIAINPTELPVYTFSATTEGLSADQSKNFYSNILLPRLSTVPGVAQVDSAFGDVSGSTLTYYNNELAYEFSVRKSSDTATTKAVANIKAVLAEIQDEHPEFNYYATLDQGEYINSSIGDILDNLVFGGLLAIAILLLFLRSIKLTLAVAISIPISVIGTFILMHFMGIGLNIVSMSGLALAVGMLVDNSVVVLENIFRLRQKGMSAKDSAMLGASQIFGAILASTLTTICVFFPMFFVKGLMMEVFMDMVWVIIFALFASLVVAVMFLPAIIASFKISGAQNKKEPRNRFTKMGVQAKSAVSRWYDSALQFCVKFKWATLGVAILVLISSVVLASANGFELMASGDAGEFTVSISVNNEYTDKDSIARALITPDNDTNTSELYDIIATSLRGDLDALAFTYNDGTGARDLESLMTSGANIAVSVKLKENKKLTTEAATKFASDALNEFFADSSKFPLDAASGAFVQSVTASSTQMTSMASDSVEVTLSVAKETGETDDTDALARLGTAIQLVRGELSALENVTVTTTFSPMVVQKVNNRIYGTINVKPDDGIVVSKIQDEVNSKMDELFDEHGENALYGVTQLSGGFEEQFNDTFGQMGIALIVGIILVYLVMVAMFQSFLTPFIIMITVPLAFTGGFLLLFVAGEPISIIALIGFMILTGVIVNNGIVLVDYINQARADGLAIKDAILTASKTRIRPILMTALTTIIALVPMALGGGANGGVMAPLAIVSIGGLIYATAMTLLVVPAFYTIFNREKKALMCEDEGRKELNK